MRIISTITSLFVFSVFISFFSSCSKEVASTSSQPTVVSKEGASSFVSLTGDTTTLTLQPGLSDGEDAYVNFLVGDAEYASSNFNYDPELAISAWTVHGKNLKQRGYIKFTGLSSLPAGARILSAQLFLYGLDPNTSLSEPQGNSLYPGSPYSSYTNNGLFISAVTGGDWSQDSITWNTMPAFYPTKFDAAIPSSTSQWNYDATADVTTLTRAMVKKNRNYGFCIYMQDEEVYRCMMFASSESANAAMRPKLVVKYTL